MPSSAGVDAGISCRYSISLRLRLHHADRACNAEIRRWAYRKAPVTLVSLALSLLQIRDLFGLSFTYCNDLFHQHLHIPGLGCSTLLIPLSAKINKTMSKS